MGAGSAAASRREPRVSGPRPDDPGAREVAGVLAPPPLIVGVPMLVALLLGWWRPWPLPRAAWAVPLGIGMVAIGFLCVIPSIAAFRRARTHPEPWKPTKALVTGGLYRVTRNPMYLGMLLVYLGITLAERTVWPLLPLPLVVLAFEVGVIRREERYLARRFGPDYDAYRRQVRRWL